MKKLLFILLFPALFACTPQGIQTIEGEWTITEYYQNNNDETHHTVNSNVIDFDPSESITLCNQKSYMLHQDGGWMGNMNTYRIVGDLIYNGCDAWYQIEWISNNKVKLISVVHTGRHLILER